MNDSIAVAEAGETQDAILAPGTVPVNSRRGPGHAMTAAKERPEEAPEVIVLAEEREAFGRFVAKVPENPQKAVALTHAAAVQQDLPVEIALLQIERLKVDLLEPAAEE